MSTIYAGDLRVVAGDGFFRMAAAVLILTEIPRGCGRVLARHARVLNFATLRAPEQCAILNFSRNGFFALYSAFVEICGQNFAEVCANHLPMLG